MNEERSGRLVLAGAGLVVLALLALVAVVLVSDGAAPPEEARTTPIARVEPIRPAPRSVRVPLPAPAGRAHPDPAEPRPPVRMDSDTKLELNRAADEVLREARHRCLEPWVDVEAAATGAPMEVVFDFVLQDGDLADMGLRSLSAEMPAEVVSCVADTVWEAEWPAFDQLPGELRLQRSLDLVPSAEVP